MDFLFHYWWLLFPLGWFIAAGWGSFMRYKRHQSKIDLIKTYTAAGKEPPAELLASLDKPDDGRHDWHEEDGGSGCLLYTSPSPRDRQKSRMPSSA